MYLAASIALNVGLLIALIVLYFRAQITAKEEKVATFAGCLRAIVDELANKNEEARWDLISKSLASARGMDSDEVRWRVVRASFVQLFRVEPALMDVGGEHVCALVAQSSANASTAEQVWDYIDAALAGKEGYGEPFERFEQKELAAAQLQYQGEIVRMYASTIEPKTIKIFA